ncbi:hypothetical protein LEP1GSC036_0520 [Leptospira weilii str. 2006001853]|uniref:Uncharacterized protein n=1 Tax=Leptospira weilii str. 2006001853 TaxID=1001589 RepID=A0A828Z1K5_9LEPT|nr:hypothetical protein LEP1GSC036_0520 [Leptospira weilii str. 2006001853]
MNNEKSRYKTKKLPKETVSVDPVFLLRTYQMIKTISL